VPKNSIKFKDSGIIVTRLYLDTLEHKSLGGFLKNAPENYRDLVGRCLDCTGTALANELDRYPLISDISQEGPNFEVHLLNITTGREIASFTRTNGRIVINGY
jgi:hypothetical protein